VTGRADLRTRLTNVLAAIAPDITTDQMLAYWFRHDSRSNEQLLGELATLRSQRLRVYLATSQEHERAHYLMDELGLARHCDGCHHSAAIGHRKRQSAFFQTVSFSAGMRPEELLLVDDLEENVRAAIRAAWHGVRWTQDQTLRCIMLRCIMAKVPGAVA
jgi:putative hydrolase of the HAD superfamily